MNHAIINTTPPSLLPVDIQPMGHVTPSVEEEASEGDSSDSDVSEYESDHSDPVDVTTTPCYFANQPGHSTRYNGIRKMCTAPGCGIYLCYGCELEDRHYKHGRQWLKFRWKLKKIVKTKK